MENVKTFSLFSFILSLVLLVLLIALNFKIKFFLLFPLAFLIWLFILIRKKSFFGDSNKNKNLAIITFVLLSLLVFVYLFTIITYKNVQKTYYVYDSSGVLTEYSYSYYGNYHDSSEWGDSCDKIVYLRNYDSRFISDNCSIEKYSTDPADRALLCEGVYSGGGLKYLNIKDFVSFNNVKDFINQNICGSDGRVFIDKVYSDKVPFLN